MPGSSELSLPRLQGGQVGQMCHPHYRCLCNVACYLFTSAMTTRGVT
jgi:hypothetical protein